MSKLEIFVLGLRIPNFEILGLRISNFTKIQILQKSPNFIKTILNITNFVGSRFCSVLEYIYTDQITEQECEFVVFKNFLYKILVIWAKNLQKSPKFYPNNS